MCVYKHEKNFTAIDSLLVEELKEEHHMYSSCGGHIPTSTRPRRLFDQPNVTFPSSSSQYLDSLACLENFDRKLS